MTVTEADSGKAVSGAPFRVHYDYFPADSPFIYHVELRTPRDVVGRTDASGRAVVKLADYAWSREVCIGSEEPDRGALFFPTKKEIREGGILNSRGYTQKPVLRMHLQPIKKLKTD